LLEQTADMVRSHGVRATAIPCDITDEAQFEGVFEKVVSEYGHLDIMVNNAGYSDRSALRHDQVPLRRMRSVVELDLIATMNGCRLAAQQMLRQGSGVIINVSSI